MADPGKKPRKVQPLARKNCTNSLEKKSTIEVLRKFDSNLFKGALFFCWRIEFEQFWRSDSWVPSESWVVYRPKLDLDHGSRTRRLIWSMQTMRIDRWFHVCDWNFHWISGSYFLIMVKPETLVPRCFWFWSTNWVESTTLVEKFECTHVNVSHVY